MGRRGTLGLAAALVIASLFAVPTGTAIATANDITIHTLTPAPGDLIPAGQVEVRAQLTAPAGIAHVEVEVDGVALASDLDDDGGTGTVTATATVTDGPHEVLVRLRDVDDAVTERRWGVTATDVVVTRLAGADRLGTAIAVSRASHPDDGLVSAAVLARADDFADALTGGPLAAHVGGPVLLTTRTALAPAVADELARVLVPDGVVHLLGGTAALDVAVAEAVRDLGFSVVRHAGTDRYTTAVTIADALPPTEEAFVASGQAFPDALAASAPAVRDVTPVLLTTRDELPAPVDAWLAEHAPERVVVVGGTAAVSAAVAEDVGRHASLVTRVAGADRHATAVAVAEHFFATATTATIASGSDFPDALAGARHAGATGAPLLLTGAAPSPGTADLLRRIDPVGVVVFGGSAAVSGAAEAAAWRAAAEEPGAPSVAAQSPAPATVVRTVEAVTLTFDRELAPNAQTYLEVAGREVVATTTVVDNMLEISDVALPGDLALETDHPVRAVVRTAATDGTHAHHATAFDLHHHDPVFATVGGVRLHEPSTAIEVMGYHQSSHEGARQLEPSTTDTPWLVMDSRGRGTGLRTAIDIVADPDTAITAPVTGRVVRAGTYVLYCEHTDHYLVIEPDEHPGWEVKLLHFRDLRVATGDRVVAGETVVGSGPRQLPFESQVDEHSGPDNHPHVHVEVVDPSIPNTGGGGC